MCQECGFNLRLKDRYLALELIGQGGFGRTFLALDEGKSPAIPCVIKQLLPQGLALPTLQKAKALFEQEALLLSELGHHPQIPTLLAYFEQDQHFYLVQDFIDGTNLAQVVAEEGAFSESQIWSLLDELLPVLQFIHDRHIIHRDIKPKNIIRRSPLPVSGQLVLVDFGAAQLVTGSTALKIGTSIGSPEYVAPEQARGKAVFASDLYSLGVSCISLLTGISPFDLFDVGNDSWVWRDYLTQQVSDSLTEILDKLIQNALTYRFQSATEVMQAINRARGRSGLKSQLLEKTTNLIAKPAPLWQCRHTFTHKLGVNSVAVSGKGNCLASGSDDKKIRLWDLNTLTTIYTLAGHTDVINSVAFSPDGTILASGSDDQMIKLWNLNAGGELYTLTGHTHKVKSVVFSPDGQYLASGSWDKTVKVWNVQTGELVCTIASHSLQVSSVAFSPCGTVLASASFDRTVRLWHLQVKEDGKLLPQLRETLVGHTWAVLAVAFSRDGKMLATGSDDNTIQLWNWETGQSIRTILGHSWSVTALVFSCDGETLVSGSWDKTIKLWQVKTGQEIATLVEHSDLVSAVAIDPNGLLIVSGSKDKAIKLWEKDEG
ncbi:MAG TPA: serine/threonine protein kinase [Cyanobacteria bacterium UBA8803]|nr:serine/threonine protein kinase [Cyanobacteria bacterium UBA9273]HBL60769.1 serine/threonine protein kinase [Cyanobacteria bacterium UBA8803]